jgi:hypothetical protein
MRWSSPATERDEREDGIGGWLSGRRKLKGKEERGSVGRSNRRRRREMCMLRLEEIVCV